MCEVVNSQGFECTSSQVNFTIVSNLEATEVVVAIVAMMAVVVVTA